MKPRLLLIFTALNLATAQNLTSPRATAMAGFSTFTNSALSFPLNPAGLLRIYDWNIGIAGYSEIINPNLKMHSFGFAKRLSENQSIGFLYSPGSTLEFTFPSNLTINLGGTILNAEFDKRITYSSNYVLGYAIKSNDKTYLGISTSYIIQSVIETGYKIQSTDSLPNLSIETYQYKSSMLGTKLGFIYEINNKFSLALSTGDVMVMLGQKLPEKFKDFEIRNNLKFRLSTGLNLHNFKTGFTISSDKEIATGFELSPIQGLFLRAGLFFGTRNFNALSIGMGFKTGLVQFDLAYFKNTSNIYNDSKLTQSEFFETPINDVELNKFIKDRISFSISIDATSWHEKSLNIKRFEIENELYPHLMHNFEKRKIGSVEIENISKKPIIARIDFELNDASYIEITSEPDEFSIKPSEIKRIPIFVSTQQSRTENAGPIKVTGKMKIKSIEKISDVSKKFGILLRGKNDWNGNVEDLKFFVKFDSPEIVSFAREVIRNKKDVLDAIDPALKKFYQAKILFDELSKYIIYVGDPNLSIDKVQYPEETLKLRTGDCDDLAVLYASLLGSIGIDVAFVDVKALREDDESHVYILFDSEIEKKFASAITKNEKKYVVLRNRNEIETLWLPIETTLVKYGFDKAWEVGAEEFFRDFEVNLAQAKGKAKIIFIQN